MDFDFKNQSDAYWREKLGSEPYRVLRKKGTERAFSNPLHANKAPGLYLCAGCGLEPFRSDEKFDSGTGWPSFWAPARDGAIAERKDRSFFMVRTEVICARCEGHLGHVFDDGPPPSGLRYCMNAAAMTFQPA